MLDCSPCWFSTLKNLSSDLKPKASEVSEKWVVMYVKTLHLCHCYISHFVSSCLRFSCHVSCMVLLLFSLTGTNLLLPLLLGHKHTHLVYIVEVGETKISDSPRLFTYCVEYKKSTWRTLYFLGLWQFIWMRFPFELSRIFFAHVKWT